MEEAKDPLTPGQKQLARTLWSALSEASNAVELELARQNLRDAPLTVQAALLDSYVEFFRNSEFSSLLINPFEA